MGITINDLKTIESSKAFFKLNGFFSKYKAKLKTIRFEAFIFFISSFIALATVSWFIANHESQKLNQIIQNDLKRFVEHFENELQNRKRIISVSDFNSAVAVEELSKHFDSIMWLDSNLDIKNQIHKNDIQGNLKTSFNDSHAEKQTLTNIEELVKITTKLETIPNSYELNFIRSSDYGTGKEYIICSVGFKRFIKELLLISPAIRVIIENENSQKIFPANNNKIKDFDESNSTSITLNNNESLIIKAFARKDLLKNYLFNDFRSLYILSGFIAIISSIIFFKLKANALKNRLIKAIFYCLNKQDRPSFSQYN